jgi:hypothetical protein
LEGGGLLSVQRVLFAPRPLLVLGVAHVHISGEEPGLTDTLSHLFRDDGGVMLVVYAGQLPVEFLSLCHVCQLGSVRPVQFAQASSTSHHRYGGGRAASCPGGKVDRPSACERHSHTPRWNGALFGPSLGHFAQRFCGDWSGRAVLPFIFHGASPGETAYYLFCCRRDIVPAQLFSGVAAAAELAVDVDLPESTFTQLGPRGAWMYMWGLAFRSVHHDTHFGMFWASSQVGPRNLLEPIEGQRVHPSGEREFLLGVNRFILYATFLASAISYR